MSRDSPLTKEQALKIRERYLNRGPGGAGMSVLAMEYGVSVTMIHNILAGLHQHTRGMPSVSGTRGGGIDDKGWREAQPPPAVTTPTMTRRAAGIVSPMSLRDQRLQHPCPTCGAKRRERCVNPRSPHKGPIAKLHDDRGK
jgi:predicted RNA-binding Zn-ribbon protein involved in translation (DUF1610 family)